MRKPLLAPVNGRRSDIKGDHLKASVRQLLSIITQPTPNYEGELSFALNVSAIKPLDEVGITDHLSPVDGLLISLSLRVESFKPACGIPLCTNSWASCRAFARACSFIWRLQSSLAPLRCWCLHQRLTRQGFSHNRLDDHP